MLPTFLLKPDKFREFSLSQNTEYHILSAFAPFPSLTPHRPIRTAQRCPASLVGHFSFKNLPTFYLHFFGALINDPGIRMDSGVGRYFKIR